MVVFSCLDLSQITESVFRRLELYGEAKGYYGLVELRRQCMWEGFADFWYAKTPQKTLKNLGRRRENTRKHYVFSGSAVTTVQNREKT